MASKRTLDERIAEAALKKEQAERQLKKLLETQKEAERKARTHRLIERGVMLEGMIEGAEALTNEQVKTILAAALNSDAALEAIIATQEQRDAEPAAAVDERPAVTGEPARPMQPAGGLRDAQGAGD